MKTLYVEWSFAKWLIITINLEMATRRFTSYFSIMCWFKLIGNMFQIFYKQNQMFNLHMFFHGGNANVLCNVIKPLQHLV
jgi:hypothetical protein